jgi:putative oxidoreductase
MKSNHSPTSWSAYEPHVRGILRIVAGFMFMLAGTSKLFGFPAPGPGGIAEPGSLQFFAGLIETIGGGLLMIGLFTRPVAFVCAGQMAVAYFMVHFPQSFWPTVNGGVPAVLYCFLWLYLSSAGAGAFSVDSLLARRQHRGDTVGFSDAHRPLATDPRM